jgi:AraC family transcriptional regulator
VRASAVVDSGDRRSEGDGPDRVLFATESVTIGAFRCPPDHPSFRDSGPIKNACFVFPRTVVEIRHSDARPFIADPTVVTLYNRAQRYERRAVADNADRCDWYAVTPDILRAALRQRDPSAAADERPIRFTHALADARTYLAQRRLFVGVADQTPADRVAPMRVEETVIALLDRVLGQAYARATRRRVDPKPALPHAVDLAEAAKRWMAPRAAEPLTLLRVADGIGSSVYHLCRSFRRATGLTMHSYHEQMRLRMALERLEGGERDLTRLALDLGYSSHSHLTSCFRRAFGLTPSATRRVFTTALRR